MGLFNWLLKNGPGSPGSTASAFVKLYEQAGYVNHKEDWEGVFFMIFMARLQAFQRMGFAGGCLLNQSDPNQIVKESQGDLPLFIFIMMKYETAAFRNSVEQHFQDVTKIIYDTVRNKKPSALMLDFPTFQLEAKFHF
ncbi:hypothetical protein BWI97_27055 [Siphonobacter sp. BAB-5405]|uniref:hypothetical protein n=1 Tax=Siphonobacter sp. BAB-5405 TaxID=1864825 RepID=UPI000C8106A9|nr:hypothetical protein [Siphonobacter sp. BAB-5405]PMD83810.1 hypothetical protein BWI97_27055 [Siphonobacter sp. BAB-5405]